MNNSRRILPILALSAVTAVALASCAGVSPGGTESPSDARVQVVASTSVYGQIVEEIGGEAVDVTSIVSSTSQDPHSFEATAQDQLAVSRADLIIENGGGYDSFIDSLIEGSDSSAAVITAAEFSHDWPENDGHSEDHHSDEDHAEDEHAEDEDHAGHDHVEGFNEHVWYDPHTIEHVAEAIAEELSELDPDSSQTFEANAAAFIEQIAGLEASLAEIEASAAGAEVFVTEPVPVYLIASAGLVNVTPEEFSEAVEEGQDVPPATLLESLDLIESGTVRVVIANSQTGGAETTQIIEAAEAQDIPVLEFSETLPEGQTYISWMQQNIDALVGVLEG